MPLRLGNIDLKIRGQSYNVEIQFRYAVLSFVFLGLVEEVLSQICCVFTTSKRIGTGKDHHFHLEISDCRHFGFQTEGMCYPTEPGSTHPKCWKSRCFWVKVWKPHGSPKNFQSSSFLPIVNFSGNILLQMRIGLVLLAQQLCKWYFLFLPGFWFLSHCRVYESSCSLTHWHHSQAFPWNQIINLTFFHQTSGFYMFFYCCHALTQNRVFGSLKSGSVLGSWQNVLFTGQQRPTRRQLGQLGDQDCMSGRDRKNTLKGSERCFWRTAIVANVKCFDLISAK